MFPSCDTQKYLQRLVNVPGGAKLPPVETHLGHRGSRTLLAIHSILKQPQWPLQEELVLYMCQALSRVPA